MTYPDTRPRGLRLTVAVLTYRRPGDLAAGLPLIGAQAGEVGSVLSMPVDATVLVVDNDPAASARETVDRLDGALPRGVALRYVVEDEPGIAAARNRAIDETAGADLLVFIDDDERPTADWLASLVREWLARRPAIVMGRVVSSFDGPLDPWIAAGRFFRRRSMPTGTAITVAAAGNLLIDRRQLHRLGVRFDSSLGLAAGEDSLFSRQLVRAGGRMTWCEESVAIDCVPAFRMTRRWVLDRARSHGNTETVVALRLASGPLPRLAVRVLALLRGSLRVAAGGLRMLAGTVSRSLGHSARGARTLHRGLGIAAGALGIVEREYARGT